MCSNMGDTVVEKRISSHGMEKKDSAYKRSNKPYMEKKRRARINNCLTQLKTLVLQAMRKDTNQYSKLEKADILEMTVKHLRQLQRHHVTQAMSHDPNVATKYRAGFNECANEVVRYLGSVNGVNTEVRSKLVNHLGELVSQVNTTGDQQSCQQLNVQIPTQQSAQAGGVPSACLLMPAGVQTSPLVLQSQNPSATNIYPSQPKHEAAQTLSHQHSAAAAAQSRQQFCGSFQIIPNTSSTAGAVAVYLGQTSQTAQPTVQTSPVLTTQQAVPLYARPTPPRTKASLKAYDPHAFQHDTHAHLHDGQRSGYSSPSPSYSTSSQDSQMSSHMSSHMSSSKLDLSLHGLAVKCGRTPSPLKVEDVWRPW